MREQPSCSQKANTLPLPTVLGSVLRLPVFADLGSAEVVLGHVRWLLPLLSRLAAFARARIAAHHAQMVVVILFASRHF